MTNCSVLLPYSENSSNGHLSKCVRINRGKRPNVSLPERVSAVVMEKLQLDVQPALSNDGYKRITNPQCSDVSCGAQRAGSSSSSTAAKGSLSHNHDIPQMCIFSHSTNLSAEQGNNNVLFTDTHTLSVPFTNSFIDRNVSLVEDSGPNLLCSFDVSAPCVQAVPKTQSNVLRDSEQLGLHRSVNKSIPPIYIPFTSEQDYSSLKSVTHRLHDSGFYYEGLSSKEATALLEGKLNGSFLLRDSSDPNHLFSLSLKTPRGTTSVRIEYHKGKFRLDSEDCLKHRMPTFDCIISLILHYVKRAQGKSNRRVLLDSTGRRDLPVQLTRPVLRVVPMLKHCSRKTICRHLKTPSIDLHKLPLPNLLKSYLSQYPYSL